MERAARRRTGCRTSPWNDPDATLARAKKLGGKVHVGPADIPGVGRFGVLEDPTGAVLAVMKALPQAKEG